MWEVINRGWSTFTSAIFRNLCKPLSLSPKACTLKHQAACKEFSKASNPLADMVSKSKETPMEDWTDGTGKPAGSPRGVFPELCSSSPVRLTVWCKSLLFNGHGYTVFDDSDGRMVFRVDNYAHNWKQETVLMDRAGNVLITIRRCRKILSLMESWEAYKGDKDVLGMVGQQKPLFKATKDLGNPSCRVSMVSTNGMEPLGYRMSWSRQREWSKIYQAAADAPLVAEVSRKYGASPKILLDKDVLTLRVQPWMDQAIAMAMIMITNLMR